MIVGKSHRTKINYTDSQTPVQIDRSRISKCWTQACAFNTLPSNFYEIKVLDPVHEETSGRQSPKRHYTVDQRKK